jgi:hypothetical protein
MNVMENQFPQPSAQNRSMSQQSNKRKTAAAGAFLLASILAAGLVMLNGWNSNVASALGMHRPVSMLEHAGGVQLDAAKLAAHVPLPMHAGHSRYWLGPISGFTYTTNCATPGVLKVGYFYSADVSREMPQAEIMISSYADEATFDANPRPLIIDPERRIFNAKGDLLTYRDSDMSTFTLRQNGSSEVIAFTYLQPKSIETMLKHSEKLRVL